MAKDDRGTGRANGAALGFEGDLWRAADAPRRRGAAGLGTAVRQKRPADRTRAAGRCTAPFYVSSATSPTIPP